MVTFVVDEGGIGCKLVPVWPFPGFPPPRPTTAQPTSIPDLIDQSQTNPKTGVLTKTFKTGKISGYRAGGSMTSSKRCRVMHTVETIYVTTDQTIRKRVGSNSPPSHSPRKQIGKRTLDA
jgi:hypothetical protein